MIEVGTTPVPFAVTSVVLSVDHDNVVGPCPYTFTFNVQLKASAAGTVTFYLESSDGSKQSKPVEVDFSEAGTKTVSRTWKFDSNYNDWVKVFVDNPNHQSFGHLNINLQCNNQ